MIPKIRLRSLVMTSIYSAFVLVLISKLFLLDLFVNLQYGSNFFFVLLLSSVDDADSGEIPVAFVIRKHRSSLSQEAVMDYVARQVLFRFLF